ncbi:MAG: hypothetical protein JW839_05400 [Candidatus Lokiarchaeota archaeon]|nr:hypothetical protein [Candidatus Lokiarchaeota archaeon]
MDDGTTRTGGVHFRDVFNRPVAKRCIISGLFVIPGTFLRKGALSVDVAFTSIILGGMAVVATILPLVLLVSSPPFARALVARGSTGDRPLRLAGISISGSGLVAGLVHGCLLAPVSLYHVTVLVLLFFLTVEMLGRAQNAPLSFMESTMIDSIVIVAGLVYGAIAGASSYPAMLLSGACVVACLVSARTFISRSGTADGLARGWHHVVVAVEVATSLNVLSILVAPVLVPMIYLALGSIGFSTLVVVYRMHARRRGIGPSTVVMRRLASGALACFVLALYAGAF